MLKSRIEKIEKIWLSTKEVAEYIGMSVEYVAVLRREGFLPHCKVKNAAFFKKSDIDTFLEKNRVY